MKLTEVHKKQKKGKLEETGRKNNEKEKPDNCNTYENEHYQQGRRRITK